MKNKKRKSGEKKKKIGSKLFGVAPSLHLAPALLPFSYLINFFSSLFFFFFLLSLPLSLYFTYQRLL